jgi:hypothetical protein
MTLPMSFRGRIGVGEGEVRSGRRSEVRRACRTEATPCVAVGAPPWPPPAPPAWPPPDRSSPPGGARHQIGARVSERREMRSRHVARPWSARRPAAYGAGRPRPTWR